MLRWGYVGGRGWREGPPCDTSTGLAVVRSCNENGAFLYNRVAGLFPKSVCNVLILNIVITAAKM